LCRGYRSVKPSWGDEPTLLASRLPEAIVASGKDRMARALEAKKKGAEVIVLDDGMQHRRLLRDIEIVTIDGSDPFGGGYFLPRGMLREDPKRLSQADLVVIVGEMALRDKKKLAKLCSAPFVEVKMVPQPIRALTPGLPISLSKGALVGVFCGIGHPERFFKQVEAMGLQIAARHALPDHKKIGKKEMEAFATLSKQKGAECLLCTEKDKVKLSEAEAPKALPVGWIPVDLEIVDGKQAWEKMLQKIKQLVGKPL
jgi:tetraacyldisaccharide 4'-kinase